jgi:hypothetical protein
MCFDSQASLLAFSLSYTIAWYIFERNRNYDRWLAGFIIAFSMIQLLEAGLWKTIERPTDHSGELNDLLTRLILLALLFQPFIQSYLGYKYTGASILAYMAIAFALILCLAFYRTYTSSPGQFNSFVGGKGHLVWSDAKSPASFMGWVGFLYLMGIFIPLLFMKDWKGWPIIIIGVLTALYSLFAAGKGEFGSYWCFTAVAVSLTALFL